MIFFLILNDLINYMKLIRNLKSFAVDSVTFQIPYFK